MFVKNIRRSLVVGTVSLCLILGQGVAFAADQGTQSTSISKHVTVIKVDIESVQNAISSSQSAPDVETDSISPSQSAPISIGDSTSKNITNSAQDYIRIWVHVEGARVRSQPNTSSTVLGLLYHANGDYIDTTQMTSDGLWFYGLTSTGIWGWVATSNLEL